MATFILPHGYQMGWWFSTEFVFNPETRAQFDTVPVKVR
jgi:hypothetical protein